MVQRIHAIAAAIALVAAFDVHAGSQRTFVASYGNDLNPCTLASPCRGFAAAIVQTSNDGEVVVLDSAGYGKIPLIDKSIAIASPAGVYAGITVSGGDGITINGVGITVALRGLTIHGLAGTNGITIVDADSVHVEACVISNLLTGIRHNRGSLYVIDTVARGNSSGLASAGPGKAKLDHVRVEGNTDGIVIQPQAQVFVHDSVVSGNGTGVYAIAQSSGYDIGVSIARSMMSDNGTAIRAVSSVFGVAAH